jgi:hypothetical protein
MNNKVISVNLLLLGSIVSSLILISFHHKYDRQLQSDNDRHAGLLKHSDFVYNSSSSCFPHNSKEWLEGKRLGNQNGTSIDEKYVASSILNIESFFPNDEEHSQRLLQHTLCHNKSTFLSTKFATSHDESESAHLSFDMDQTIPFLALRLIYLVTHIHQHKYAMEEALHRSKYIRKCEREMRSKKIGKFDFECPNAKFLVVPMKQRGLGALMRTDAVTALMAGIATDRVVLFVNRSPQGPDFLQSPWAFASCPRHDKQCFFLPDSPCVLTHDDIRNATVLERGDRRKLYKTGQLPEAIQNKKVVAMNTLTRPQRMPLNFLDRVAQLAKEYVLNPLMEDNPNDSRLPRLSATVHYILKESQHQKEEEEKSFNYFGRNSKAHHAMVLYAMRPNFEYAQRLDEIVSQALGEDHDTEMTLGLPIRASDKCIDESECLPFDDYMDMIQTVWDKNKKSMVPKRQIGAKNIKVILTSESPDILKAQEDFKARNSTHFPLTQGNGSSVPFEFITNKFDLLQNSGNPTEMEDFINKEDIILSSLASLKLQFHAKYTIGNCCSNHHLLLLDFLQEGCGASDHHAAGCMQDHENPKFRLCCGWTKTENCQTKRNIREQRTKKV